MGYQGAYSGPEIDKRLGKVPQIEKSVESVQEDINALRAAVGNPMTASTTDTTSWDTSKIYVYIGETDSEDPHIWIQGNWYFWNGTAWTSGGVYQSSGVETDTTLSVPGAPADGKVTGDEISFVKQDLETLAENGDFQAEITFEQGGFYDGEETTNYYKYRLRTPTYYLLEEWEGLAVNRTVKSWVTYIYYYNENYEYIADSMQDTTSSNIKFTFPEGSVYFRIMVADATGGSATSNRVYPENGREDYRLRRVSNMQSTIKNLTVNTQAIAYIAENGVFSWQRDGNTVTVDFSGGNVVLRKGTGSGTTIAFSDIVSGAEAAGWTATETGVIAPSHSCGIYYDLDTSALVFRTAYSHPNLANYVCLFENHYASFGAGLLVDYATWSSVYTQKELKTLTSNTQAVAYLGGGKSFFWKRSGNTVNVDISGASIIMRLKAGTAASAATTIYFADFTAAVPENWTVTETGVIAPSHSCGIYYDLQNKSLVFRAGFSHPNDYNLVCLFENWYTSFGAGLLVDYATTKNSHKPDDDAPSSLPDYYEEHIKERIPTIRENVMKCGKHGETFIFITDLHWEQNIKNSPALIERIMKSANIGAIICGGDLINQGEREKMASTMAACIGAFQLGKPFPVAMGNHDDNWNNWPPKGDPRYTDHQRDHSGWRFSLDDVYGLMQKQSEDSVTYITNNRFNLYYDRPTTKTRFIVLDTWDTTAEDGREESGDPPNGNYGFTEYSDLANCLNSTPAGYHIILATHAYYAGGGLTSYTANIEAMVDAYNARETVTINNTPYNFSTGSAEVVLLIGGHVHKDMDFETPDGIPLVLSDCDVGARSQNTDYPYAAGTITEQAFDVISIDYTAKSIKFVRIGRGADRTFSYLQEGD